MRLGRTRTDFRELAPGSIRVRGNEHFRIIVIIVGFDPRLLQYVFRPGRYFISPAVAEVRILRVNLGICTLPTFAASPRYVDLLVILIAPEHTHEWVKSDSEMN